MMVRLREIYREPSRPSIITYNFERIHVKLCKDLNIKLVDGYLAIIGGTTLSMALAFRVAAISSGLALLAVGSTAAVAVVIGVFALLILPIAVGVGYALYLKYRQIDEFTVGRDIEYGLKIVSIMNTVKKYRNCTLSTDDPDTKQTEEAYSRKILFEVSKNAFLSAAVLNDYTFSTVPTQSFEFTPLIGRDFDEAISEFLSRELD